MRRKNQQRPQKYQHRMEILRVAGSTDAAGHKDYTNTDAWEVLGFAWFSLDETGQSEGDRAEQIETTTTYDAATPFTSITRELTSRDCLRNTDGLIYNIRSRISRDDANSELVFQLGRTAIAN